MPGFGIFILLLIALAFVLVGIGIVFGIALLVLIISSLGFGIISASLLTGMYYQSLRSGFKTLVILTFTAIGAPVASGFLFILYKLHLIDSDLSSIIIAGTVGGAIAGAIIGMLIFKGITLTLSMIKKRIS